MSGSIVNIAGSDSNCVPTEDNCKVTLPCGPRGTSHSTRPELTLVAGTDMVPKRHKRSSLSIAPTAWIRTVVPPISGPLEGDIRFIRASAYEWKCGPRAEYSIWFREHVTTTTPGACTGGAVTRTSVDETKEYKEADSDPNLMPTFGLKFLPYTGMTVWPLPIPAMIPRLLTSHCS